MCGSGGVGPNGCKVCGWPAKVSVQARQPHVLCSVERDLQRYAQAGLIDEQVLARLTAALKEEPVKPAPELISTELVTAEAIEEATPFATPKSPEPAACRGRAGLYGAAGGTRSRRAGSGRSASPEKPVVPRSEIFKAFMEEKNIRWGELVGGLLIVCSSIALVSASGARSPSARCCGSSSFNGVTAALFGLGYYMHRHWKLGTTSQGLLYRHAAGPPELPGDCGHLAFPPCPPTPSPSAASCFRSAFLAPWCTSLAELWYLGHWPSLSA